MKLRIAIVLLALTAAHTESAPLAAQTTSTPTYRTSGDFLHAPREGVIEAFGLQPLDPSHALDRMIREEADRLDEAAGFESEVWISERARLNSHPQVGIIVNRAQLEDIRRTSNVQQFRAVLRFLLAHEKAHQIQYRQHSALIASHSDEEKRVYEAQADILGAKHLAEALPPTGQREALHDALRVAFDLGVEQYALSTHPSHEARRSATRLGLAAGQITHFLAAASDPDNPIPDRFLQSAQVLMQKLDIKPREETLSWSLRIARRLINYSRPAIIDLVLTEQKIEFNENGMPPVVRYELTYQNLGDRSLEVDLEVQSVSVPREDPDDTMRWLKISSAPHRFHLPPGQSRTLAGMLTWDANQELRPRLVAPPEPTAQVTVHYSGETASTTGGLADPLPAAPRSADAEDDFGITLLQFMGEAASGYHKYRTGPGRHLGDVIIYPSVLSLPSAIRTDIEVPTEPEGEPSVSSQYYVGSSRTAAEGQFERLVALVRASLAGWLETPRTGTGTRLARSVWFQQSGDVNRVWVQLSEAPVGRYRVSVNISSRR